MFQLRDIIDIITIDNIWTPQLVSYMTIDFLQVAHVVLDGDWSDLEINVLLGTVHTEGSLVSHFGFIRIRFPFHFLTVVVF